jgi:hypothetical protein
MTVQQPQTLPIGPYLADPQEKLTRSWLPDSATSRKGRASLRMNLDFQVDPLACASSISIMALFGALLVKRSGLSSMKKRRDSAAESLRKAKIALLAGNLDLESYERTATVAEASAQEYEAAKNIIPLGQAQVQIEDWSASPVPREMKQTTKGTGNSRAPNRNEVPQMTQSVVDRQGDSLQQRADGGSELESVSSPLGDVMFGLTIAPLICLFVFSLNPDPVMEAQNPSALDPLGCEPCVQLHAQGKSASLAQPSE